MNFSFFIAKRYLRSKKSHNIINIVSWVSVIGVTIGSMALIVVLSVFNGFEGLIVSLYNSFDPEIKITLKEGRLFDPSEVPASVKALPEVAYYTQTLEENALIKYKDHEYIATVKGVEPDFRRMTGIDTMVSEGSAGMENKSANYALLGQGVAYYLTANIQDFQNPLTIYVPKKLESVSYDPMQAFNAMNIFPCGTFSIQQDFDIKYVLVPLRFARELTGYANEVSAVEIGLSPGTGMDEAAEKIQAACGNRFEVKTRFQQHEFLYKVMKSEKWAVWLILSFILMIAVFNIIGSLSMLIIEKKKDIFVLKSLGASRRMIRLIFLSEGILINMIGALIGISLGALICFLQQQYGLITIEGGGSFVITAYPVKMIFSDFVAVFLTVFLIGLAVAWFPVRQATRPGFDKDVIMMHK